MFWFGLSIGIIYGGVRSTGTGTPLFGLGLLYPTFQNTGEEIAVIRGDLWRLNYTKTVFCQGSAMDLAGGAHVLSWYPRDAPHSPLLKWYPTFYTKVKVMLLDLSWHRIWHGYDSTGSLWCIIYCLHAKCVDGDYHNKVGNNNNQYRMHHLHRNSESAITTTTLKCCSNSRVLLCGLKTLRRRTEEQTATRPCSHECWSNTLIQLLHHAVYEALIIFSKLAYFCCFYLLICEYIKRTVSASRLNLRWKFVVVM